MLGLTQKEVAAAALLSEPTVKRFEQQAGELSGHSSSINALVRTLEGLGVEFIADGEASGGGGPGVRMNAAGLVRGDE